MISKKNKKSSTLLLGKKIYSIGYGCGIGNYSRKYDYSLIKSIIKNAYNIGYNFFDTAPIYGFGLSEKYLGSSLTLSQKDKCIIATKISPEMLSAKNIHKSVMQSKKNLGIDRIDLVQLHWPNPKINLKESLDALLELKNKEHINGIGICNYDYNDVKKIFKFYDENILSTFQIEYNFFDRTIESKIKKLLDKKKVRILAYSPLAQGRIFNGRRQKNILDEISFKYDLSIDQIVLNWIVNFGKSIPIPNTLNVDRLKNNFLSLNKKINTKDLLKISNLCKSPIEKIDCKNIIVKSKFNKKVYVNIKQAKINKFKMSPSPTELSQKLLIDKNMKPIRIKLEKSRDKKKLFLLEGRLRFWAWIIAFGWNKKIPTLIWYND